MFDLVKNTSANEAIGYCSHSYENARKDMWRFFMKGKDRMNTYKI